MPSLPLIPTPPAQRWREFRMRFFPSVVFLGAVLGVVVIWKEHVAAPTMVGAVESVQVQVRCPDDGTVSNLFVTLYEKVQTGDPVAELSTTDPRTALARLELADRLRALRLQQEHPELDQQRGISDYQRLRVDLMNQEVALATAQVNLERAQAEWKRKAELHKANVASDTELEFAAKEQELYAAEVTQRSNSIVSLGQSLKLLEQQIAWGTEIASNRLATVEEARHELTRLSRTNLVLTAPTNGVVTAVFCRAGESLRVGDPIVTITSPVPERIRGYLRQPFPFEPRKGLPVKVRTHSPGREEGLAEITDVGSQFEIVTPVLSRVGLRADVGLPIAISVPPNLSLRPGELVDLTISSDIGATRSPLASRPAPPQAD